MASLQKELGKENAALARVIEETMARYFRDAEEKSEARMNRLEKRIESMHSVLSRHTEEIKSIRSETVDIKECVTATEKNISECQKKQHTLETKLTEMEDRARRENLLIFNLKEGAEGPNALSYLKENIPLWFPIFVSVPPELMRAHRLGRSPVNGKTQRSRPLIIRCLRYTDRDALLNEARKNPPEVDNIQLRFTADYSDTTTKRRKPCYKIMHEARIRGFQAFLLYPSTIKLIRGNDARLFQEPSEAERFLATLEE